MKKGVILCSGHRKLEDPADKIRHNCATATSLWIEMADIGKRHVITRLNGFQPLRIPVQYRGSKSFGPVLTQMLVDAASATKEFLPILEKIPIMIQILDVYLKSRSEEH